MAKVVNKRDLAEILGISERSLTEWQHDGMPILVDGVRGEENKYDTEAVIKWWLHRELRKVQNESPKDRLSRLQADRVQMDIDEKNGKLISVDLIEPAWEAMVLSARSMLRGAPDRLATLLELTEGVDAKRDLLAETFDDYLRKLSTYSDDDDTEGPAAGVADASAEEDGSASEADGLGVGGAV